MKAPVLLPRVHPRRRSRKDSGQALLEFLVVMPALLLMIFGIIEMAAAWRAYQVVTNTAREGARIAVLPSADEATVLGAVGEGLVSGGLDPSLAAIQLLCATGEGNACFGAGRSGGGTEVRISYPYTFRLLGPLARFSGGGGDPFGTITIQTGIVMRNE